MININVFAIAFLIFVSTVDAIVIPLVRLSIADVSLLFYFLFRGFTREGIFFSLRFLLFFFPFLVGFNILLSINYYIYIDSDFYWVDSMTGFFRPIMFSLFAINFYFDLKKNKVQNFQIYKSICYASLILTVIIVLQYFSFWPAQYHNNPSFGESGRWTVFHEGWRPTGLTNEASFVGIFMFLIFSLQIFLREKIEFSNLGFFKFSPFLTFLGCYLTTSRLAILLAVIIFIVSVKSLRIRFLFLICCCSLMFLYGESEFFSRIMNVAKFDGDSSTLERYGSLKAYLYAIISGNYIFGVGYLNGVHAASGFIDPLVNEVLGSRAMPSFSLPVQLQLEFGVFFVFFCIFIFIKYRFLFFSFPINAIILASLFTGIQNFVFVYVFFSLMLYVKRNTCN